VPHFREEFLTLAVMTARDHGFFAANGLDATLIPVYTHNGGSKKSHPYAKGELPANLLNDFNVATSIAQATPLCEFGTSNVERFLTHEDAADSETVPLLLSAYGENYDTHLVVSSRSKIKTIADLKGKTVRLGQAPVRMAMEAILSEAGLTLSDIKQDYSIAATEVLAKLESGQLDAAVTYVPTMPYMLASGKVRVLKSNIVKSYLGASVPHSLVIANRKFAMSSGGVVKRFLAAITQATEYIRRNPSEAVYALQRNSKLLGNKPWHVSKVTVEKAGEFIGKISTLDLFTTADHRLEAQGMLKNYGAMLKTHNLISQQTDLAGWLGVNEKDNKVTSL
jgi:hypothetical protein